LCAVLVGLGASVANAQQVKDASRAAARDLGYAGVESYQAGDYEAAFGKLDKAYRVLQVPSLGLWSARALVKTNRWVEAAERFRQVAALEVKGGDVGVQEQAKRDAQQELDALLPRLPRLVVRMRGPNTSNASVSVDGEAISSALLGEPFPANPGKHVVRGQLDGQEATESVVLAEGESRDVALSFGPGSTPAVGTAPAAAPLVTSAPPEPALDAQPSRARAIVGWALLGTGAAGVALGATTGFIAVGKKSDLESSDACRNHSCLPVKQSDVDSYNSLRTISTIGLYGGAALAAAGLVLVITAPKHATAPSTAGLFFTLSPTGGSVSGRF
jgi:hypothetical protein